MEILASGGIRNAYDIFKALCLGANAVGTSGTVLTHLMNHGVERNYYTDEAMARRASSAFILWLAQRIPRPYTNNL